MRLRILFSAILLALALSEAGCSGSSSAPSSGTPIPAAGGEPALSSVSGGELSAKEAVALAYEALTAEWKPNAKLAFVGRWSQYCKDCSPFNVEEDPGIRSDGRQAHWVVIFADSASSADVFYVEDGKAKLVASDVTTMYGTYDLFSLDGWVDSTAIEFRTSQPVGLELKAGHFFEGTDPDLEGYAVLWLAETSFWKFDVYDATTGKYIKSR
ncbi:hypothetical protein [Anaerolinea sp.]|uniref:hypothetical protein n=1 Tax=Anaerolinea sp. TaxID=1872519 RepID=UPI002ACD34F8|nr:hypothetical protein [Anaerolinea sp.]